MNHRLNHIAYSFNSKIEELRQSSQLNRQELHRTVFPLHISSALQIFYKFIRENLNLFIQPDIADLNREKERALARHQNMKLFQLFKVDLEKNPYYFEGIFYAMATYSFGSTNKWIINYMLYVKTLMTLGTNSKARYCIEKASTGEHIGCFALTEMYHGSFNRGMKSEAHYDHKTKSFAITTNEREGQKFWIGGAAQIANMSVFWAQLIIDGVLYGPHPFIIPLRDEITHEVLPGIKIGDVGPKNGNDAIDNGWIRIANIQIPLQNLLDKVGSINEKGEYVSKIKSNDQRFGIQMSSISTGRSFASPVSLASTTSALAIAIRYITVRRQFSSDPITEENFLIDYPLTKQRMMMPLAETFVNYFSCFHLSKLYSDHEKQLLDPKNSTILELHAISTVLKSISGVFGLETITKCRQMLGGHGYSAFSRLKRIYHDHDPTNTAEGDNMLLLQQASKVLLQLIPTGNKWKFIDLSFLKSPIADPKQTKEGLDDVNNLRLFFQKLVSIHYEEVLEETRRLKMENSNDLWNELQPYFCNSLALAFGHYFLFQEARKGICEKEMSTPNKQFLLRCLKTWTCSILLKEKYGNIKFRTIVEERMMELCEEIAPDSIVAIDAIAPPKYVVQSPFMDEEGEGMKQYLNLVMTGEDTFSRVEWYKKLLGWRSKVEE